MLAMLILGTVAGYLVAGGIWLMGGSLLQSLIALSVSGIAVIVLLSLRSSERERQSLGHEEQAQLVV